jgi:hypothetical protein
MGDKEKPLGRHKVEYTPEVPKFLQKFMAKEQAKVDEEKKRDLTMPDRPDMEDEVPLVVADDDLKAEYDLQKIKQKEIEREQEIERLNEQDKRVAKKIAEKSKFVTSEENVVVFHSKSELKTDDSEDKDKTKKRKANTAQEKIEELRKKQKTTANSDVKSKPTNTKLLSFNLDDEEQ